MARQSAIPVLVTRPEPQASRLAANLVARFGDKVRPVLTPLMREEALSPALPEGPFAAVVVTSEAGARAAGRLRAKLPGRAICVGERTAEAARDAGFDAVALGGDAAGLVAGILAGPDAGPLLWLRGADRAADLGAMLAAGGRRLAEAVVYAQREQALSAGAETVLRDGGPVLVPLYSPRSARLFAAAVPDGADVRCVVMSEAVRAALPPALAAGAVVAERPEGAAMMQAIFRALTAALP